MTNFAFDAVNRGYQFVMPTDAVAGVPADYAAAVIANTLSLVATLTTTEAVLAAWPDGRPSIPDGPSDVACRPCSPQRPSRASSPSTTTSWSRPNVWQDRLPGEVQGGRARGSSA